MNAMSAYIQHEDGRTVRSSTITCAQTTVTVMIFRTGSSQLVTDGRITTTQNQEANHLIPSPHFFHKAKIFKAQPSAAKCTLTFACDYRGIIQQQYVVKGTKINSETSAKDIKRLRKQTNHSHWGERSVFLQNENATPQTIAAPAVVTAPPKCHTPH